MRNQYDIMGLFLVLGCGGEGDLTVVFSPTPEPRPSTQSPSLPPEQETSSQGVMSRLEPTLPGRLERSEANGLVVNAPQWLSETGVFEELTSLTPRAQFVRYEVQQPLFTDRAVKTRWFALPEGEHIGFKPLEAWEFPVGTVLVKQFDMALDRRRPEAVARLETRLLVAAGGGSSTG